MLKENYVSSLTCCVWLKTKFQIRKLNINLVPGVGTDGTSMQEIKHLPGNVVIVEQKDALKQGSIYSVLDIHYACGSPSCACPVAGFESVLDGEIVSETILPAACWCFGPFTVKHKGLVGLGQLKPTCYFCKACVPKYYWCWHPWCMKLDINSVMGQHLFTIERTPCTCICCTEWLIYNNMRELKGSIQQGGCWLWCPKEEINLPAGPQEIKRLVLGSFGVLP